MALITLTSDIGRQDFLTGAIKGQLLQLDPGYRIVDISHDVSSFNYPQAAYMCSNAIKNFPKNTLHLIMINVYDKKKDHLLLIRHAGQYIGIADNGLIKMILNESPDEKTAVPWKDDKSVISFATTLTNAFRMVSAGASLDEVGDTRVEIEEKNPLRPMQSAQFMEGHIIFIDNFENVIINITREEFEQQRRGRSFKIHFTRGEIIEKMSETYADVPESEKLARFNSAGYLEIAVNKGNAAGLFGLTGFVDPKSQYTQSRLLYQTIRIIFE